MGVMEPKQLFEWFILYPIQAMSATKFGGRSRSRTCNPGIKNPMLCLLSYVSMTEGAGFEPACGLAVTAGFQPAALSSSAHPSNGGDGGI